MRTVNWMAGVAVICAAMISTARGQAVSTAEAQRRLEERRAAATTQPAAMVESVPELRLKIAGLQRIIDQLRAENAKLAAELAETTKAGAMPTATAAAAATGAPLKTIAKGMTRAQVEAIWGKPEQTARSDEGEFSVWREYEWTIIRPQVFDVGHVLDGGHHGAPTAREGITGVASDARAQAPSPRARRMKRELTAWFSPEGKVARFEDLDIDNDKASGAPTR
jgi:hypothetical protein